MISIIICSINPEQLAECKESIAQTIGTKYELIVEDNRDANKSLAQVYNEAAKKAQYKYIVFVHEDTGFWRTDWGYEVVDLLKKEYVGAVGVAGTRYMDKNGFWAAAGVPFLKGQVLHPQQNLKKLTKFSEDEGVFEVVAIDGVFMATRKDIVEEIPFDEKTFDAFHFYDIDFSMRVAQKYSVLVTTNIRLYHYSKGNFGDIWGSYRDKFLEKFKDILPYSKWKETPDPVYKIPYKTEYL